ncbi:hypothetical protein L1049_017716 [Liquidambar formosana]|uniref:Beta-glucuronosyltransferase GlcAT14A n=1 Tax=Liquidambar formosana TaxID=63359 RepID=A0AAP0X3X4_LIQFO
MQNPPFSTTTTTTTTATTTTATTTKDNKTLCILILPISLFSLFLLLSLSSSSTSLQLPPPSSNPFLFPRHHHHHRTLFINPNPSSDPDQRPSPPTPPSIAYFISGSTGDSGRILRLLLAIYHPKNHYLLHLDLSAPQTDRDLLAIAVQSIPIFKAAQNVNVVGKADFAYPKGSSAISSTLRGASILLRLSSTWDWFINLSAADYPLVTQDDLLHILSFLPKNLNFVNHTSYIGWKESRRLKPIIVDPGLYLSEKTEIFYASQRRELPNAYRLFTGSSSAILSRKFIEFCILGSDNLPRTVLMYLSNTPSSLPDYFPTVLCNSQQFNRTTVNHNLQYASLEPRPLSSSDFDSMIQSGAAFATQFQLDDPVLDLIDQVALRRRSGEAVPGGWCLGESENDTCSVWGDADVLRPGPGAQRLEKNIVKLLSNGTVPVSSMYS